MHQKMVATQQIADIVEMAEVLTYKENQLPETDWSIRETQPRTQIQIFISFFPQTDPFGRRIVVGFNLDFEDLAADELLTAARTLSCKERH